MFKKRLEGDVQIIYSHEKEYLEEIALGLISRATGHNYKVAFVTQKPHSRYFTFFENLCISHRFPKFFERLHIETFLLGQQSIQRGILPQVEFQTIPYKSLLNTLYTFDIIIILNPNDLLLDSPKFIDFISQKQDETEIIILMDKTPSTMLKKVSDSLYFFESKKNNALTSNPNVTIVNNSIFSELFSYGYLIKKFIEKSQVKLVAFEKGDQMYGESKFFRALKQFSKEYHFYGSFDYVHTGLPRISGPTFRKENTLADTAEAKEALMLAQTSLRKLTPVVIENIDSISTYNLFTNKEEYSLFRHMVNEAIIPIKFPNEYTHAYLPYCGMLLTFMEEKSRNSSSLAKKGIHF